MALLNPSAAGLSASIAHYRAELESAHRRLALTLQYHRIVETELSRLVQELHSREGLPTEDSHLLDGPDTVMNEATDPDDGLPFAQTSE